jgi:hypothetical protein
LNFSFKKFYYHEIKNNKRYMKLLKKNKKKDVQNKKENKKLSLELN